MTQAVYESEALMFLSPWLLFCMTFLSLAGGGTVQKSISEDLYAWIKVAPPKAGSEEWSAARDSEYEWQVEMKNGRPTAHRRNVKAEEAATLPALIKRNRGPHPEPGEIHSIQVTDGWLISFDAGEGGGSLWWYGADGRQSYKVSNDHIRQFLPANRSLFALEGMANYNSSRGQIVQLRQNAQGQWMSIRFYDLGHAPYVGLVDGGGDFIVCTTDNLVRVHPDQTETVLLPKVFWSGLSPRSMAISATGDIYLGMHEGVSIVYPLNKAYMADWLLPNKDFVLGKPKN
jgi:hypothetical protein